MFFSKFLFQSLLFVQVVYDFTEAVPVPAVAATALTGGLAFAAIPLALDAAAMGTGAGAAALAAGAAGSAGAAAAGVVGGISTATSLTGAAVAGGMAGSVATGAASGAIGAAVAGPAVVATAVAPTLTAGFGVAFGGVCLTMGIIGDNGYDMKCWKQIIDPDTLSPSDLENYEISGMPISVARKDCEMIVNGHGLVYLRTPKNERFLVSVADASGKYPLLHVSPFIPQRLIKDVE